MKSLTKSLLIAIVILTSSLLVGCRITNPDYASGSGANLPNATGPYTISGTVTGLVSGSTGVVLQDNSGDNMTLTGNGTFTFKTAIVGGQTYNVSVFAPPTTPPQTCTVANGSGTVVANVNTVQITCSSGTVSIGGNALNVLGIGLVLQDNNGDNLAIPVSNPFTFKTALPIGSAYNVTVLTQPTSPTQTCTVTYGSGTANVNVGNIQITCSTGTLSVGGTISGLAKSGSGIVLQNNGKDSLVVGSNGSFTFPTLIPAGGAYNATIQSQPAGPNQLCTVTGGQGTTVVNINSIQIVCNAIFHTIGGTTVGVVGQNGGMVLQNNLGDNLVDPGNGVFTFNTPIADGSTYDVSVLVSPNTQPGVGVVVWNPQGTASSAVSSVIVDGGHNDWAWFDGTNLAESKGSFNQAPGGPVLDTDSPGGRNYPATWTDASGNLWLFGGYGYSYPVGFTPPATNLDDMWEYIGVQNYFGSFFNYWTNPIPPGSGGSGSVPVARNGAITWTQLGGNGDLFLFGGQSGAFKGGSFLNDVWRFNTNSKVWTQVYPAPLTLPLVLPASTYSDRNGVYGTQGVPSSTNIPGSRWGAVAKTDSTGKLWLFGGYGFDSVSSTPGLLNDLWTFNLSTNQWTWVSGSKTINQSGTYGTLGVAANSNVPGSRQASMCWLDAAGNFWLFGGFDLDSKGNPDALNDLWEYKAGQWTWVSGSNVVNSIGVYGTQGVAAATNVPGARWSSASWTDAIGNFYLFGGEGYDPAGNGSLSDLWVYSGGTWIWVKGPSAVSQPGIYGLKPGPIIYPYVGNNPGSRYAPGYWIDHQNFFWMFGGEGFDATGGNGNGLLDDLWRYVPYPHYPSLN